METNKVFEETSKLENEIKKLEKELEKVNNQLLVNMELCPHEIVFKYTDNCPRKLVIDGTYYCPACGKTIKCFMQDQIMYSAFKNSRIIPLPNLSLIGTSKNHDTLRKEIYSNMDIYYNSDYSVKELSSKMEEKLKDQEYDFTKPIVLSKRKNKI